MSAASRVYRCASASSARAACAACGGVGFALRGRDDAVAQAGDRVFVDAIEALEVVGELVEDDLLRLVRFARALLKRLVLLQADQAADDVEARLGVGVEELASRRPAAAGTTT